MGAIFGDYITEGGNGRLERDRRFSMSVIANNRFLQRTNPTMLAAIDDGGSVLDRVYIQNAARQIVDQGHWSNLKFWGCAGLAEIDTRSSVDYVPKLYDLSGEGNDLIQADNDKQPKWTSEGLDFDGSNDYLYKTTTASLTNIGALTYMGWFYLQKKSKTMCIFSISCVFAQHNVMLILNRSANNIFIYGRTTSGANVRPDAIEYTDNTFNHIAMTRNASGAHKFYFNGDDVSDNVRNEDGTIDLTTGEIGVGGRYLRDNNTADQLSEDFANDLRIYNSVLTATEIAAIYDQTKSYYGIS